MKCRLSSKFKTLSFELAIVTAVVVSIVAILMGFVTGVGYITLHWFDLSLVGKASSPFEFYLLQGFITIFLTVMLALFLRIIYTLILYPLYYLIFNFKKILNFIFDCKGN